jgi:uncharacterized membrane protein
MRRAWMRGLVGVAAGTVVVGALSGWGQPQERPPAAQDAAAARAVAAITAGDPGAGRAVPADFATVMGYRPEVVATAQGTTATRASGGCTSPFGETGYGFGAACRQHDLGYDLLRYAQAKGEPLGPWARRAIDDHFLATMRERCDHLGCQAMAGLYYGVVEVNSIRQGWGTPVVEGVATLLPPVGAGVLVALLVGSARLRAGLLALRVSRAARRRLQRAGAAVARVCEPRAGRVLVAVTALATASQPGVIPRPAWVQALMAALAAANAYAVAALGGALWRRVRRRFAVPDRLPRLTASVTGRTSAILLPLAAVGAYAGQLHLTRVTGMAPPSLTEQVAATAGAVALAALVTGAVAVAAAGVRRAAKPVATTLLVPALVFGGPGAAAAATVPDETGAGPAGRTWLAAAPTAAQVGAVTGKPALAPVRVYVGRGQAASPAGRARLAVRELEAKGAFERAVVLVAVPTGSGWVNNAAAGSLEYLYGGDTAAVAVQYADSPSWVAYLQGGEGARDSVRALVDAVTARAARQPAGRRPQVVVYGESLGAWGGMTAYPRPEDVLRHADRALWTGIPAAAPDVTPVAGRMATLNHPDDPVPAWSTDLLVRPSEDWPHPWLPVVTFWQVTGDVIAALGTPDGHGHRYGPELVDEWLHLSPPDPAQVPTAAPEARWDEVRAAVRR